MFKNLNTLLHCCKWMRQITGTSFERLFKYSNTAQWHFTNYVLPLLLYVYQIKRFLKKRSLWIALKIQTAKRLAKVVTDNNLRNYPVYLPYRVIICASAIRGIFLHSVYISANFKTGLSSWPQIHLMQTKQQNLLRAAFMGPKPWFTVGLPWVR